MERIKAAAIRQNGVVYTLPVPARHHDIIKYMVVTSNLTIPIKGEQGFITDSLRFVDRVEGKMIATKACQLLDRAGNSDELFSEDVWYGIYNR